MHPGGVGGVADPNAAFFLDGIYHLHYIMKSPWQGKISTSYWDPDCFRIGDTYYAISGGNNPP